MQKLDTLFTTWHITFGTYLARVHGGPRPTVSKQQNTPGEPFIDPDPTLEKSMRKRAKHSEVILPRDQRCFIQDAIPDIIARGGWRLRTCAAGPDHIHVLLDIDPKVHGEKVRRLIKRWLGQALNDQWPRPKDASWWADEGSNIAIHDEEYLNNAFGYIERQRA